MKKEKDCYEVCLYGQNGECIPHTNLKITAQQMGTTIEAQKMLTTNADGKVKMGRMALVTGLKVTAEGKYGNTTKTWRLNNLAAEINYASTIYYKKG